MGRITVKTKENCGQVTYETETIYESFDDFLYLESSKRDAMNQAVKSFVDSQLFGGYEEPVEESAVVDINVKKKDKLH